MTQRLPLILALLALTLLSAGAVRAEHEADHRYSIRGYVLSADEQPLAGVRVSATLEGQLPTSAQTDEDGFYTLNLHLHDGDIGREIALRAGDARATIRVTAERGDQHTERIHLASFVGLELREDALGRFQMPGWGWVVTGVAGFVLLMFLLLRLQRFLKRRKRAAQERAKPADLHPPKPKKRKKRRR